MDKGLKITGNGKNILSITTRGMYYEFNRRGNIASAQDGKHRFGFNGRGQVVSATPINPPLPNYQGSFLPTTAQREQYQQPILIFPTTDPNLSQIGPSLPQNVANANQAGTRSENTPTLPHLPRTRDSGTFLDRINGSNNNGNTRS